MSLVGLPEPVIVTDCAMFRIVTLTSCVDHRLTWNYSHWKLDFIMDPTVFYSMGYDSVWETDGSFPFHKRTVWICSGSSLRNVWFSIHNFQHRALIEPKPQPLKNGILSSFQWYNTLWILIQNQRLIQVKATTEAHICSQCSAPKCDKTGGLSLHPYWLYMGFRRFPTA